MKHNPRAATFGRTHQQLRAHHVARDLLRDTYPRRTYTGTGIPDNELISLAARLRYAPDPRRRRRLMRRATRNLRRAAIERLPYWHAHGHRSPIAWDSDTGVAMARIRGAHYIVKVTAL